MKIPSLLRPHAVFAPLPDLSDAELLGRLARQLERRGASRITLEPAGVRFRADGMDFDVSPLAACAEGELALRRTPALTRIEHGVRLDLLSGRAALCLCTLVALCGCFIVYGRFAPTVIAALFYLGGVAGTYLAVSDQMRRIVDAALAPVAPPRVVRYAARLRPRQTA